MVQPRVGIGILNWNGKQFLEQFLPPLYNVTYPNVAIYVIDNASSDDSLAYLRQHHPQVTIIETGGNFGVPGGYNIGFSQMPEPYLLMLNSDVAVEPGFLEPLIALMEADNTIAITQSKLLAYHHPTQFEYGGAAGGMLDVLGYSFCRGRIFDRVEVDNNQYQTGDVFWAGGACCLIRKEAYHKIGGMYPYFFMHFEEVDMCWRFHSFNYRVMFCNESVAYHVGGGTLSYQSPVKTYYNFRNNLIMVMRNSTLLYKLWWLPVRFGMDVLAALRFLQQRDTANAKAIMKGYGGLVIWLFKHTPDKMPRRKKSLRSIPTVLQSSIIWQFFIKSRKTYPELKQ